MLRARPEISSVIHIHPPTVVAFTIAGKPLLPIIGAYNPGALRLITDGLPAASPDKTYEAWVITGKRVQPAGLFHGGAGRKYVLLTKPVRAPAKVAVTLEKRGGVSAPTTAILLQAQVKPS